jgi:hypothetical protein
MSNQAAVEYAQQLAQRHRAALEQHLDNHARCGESCYTYRFRQDEYRRARRQVAELTTTPFDRKRERVA